ncbi:MAG: HlyD family efflux transporter periplasmic adaptor subunit [Fuerstiella sp.]
MIMLLLNPVQTLVAQDSSIHVQQVTISLAREAELPARDAGTLFAIEVIEGQAVSTNDVIAVLENEEQLLQLQASKLNLQIASLKAEDELPVLSAKAQLREAQSAKTVKEVALKIAEAEALSDSAVGIATAEVELRKHELERAVAARSSFKGSISEAQIDRLKTSVAKGQLEIKQAQEALAVQRMKPAAEKASLNQKLEEIARYNTVLQQEQKNQLIAGVNNQLQVNAVEMAQLQLEQRNIRAPFDGVIAKIEKQAGEWVVPGAPVARIIDLKRLRAEGFLSASDGSVALVGKGVRIVVSSGGTDIALLGKVTFVSQEIDPVNQQVRFWAEFDNSELQVLPGMIASLEIQK